MIAPNSTAGFSRTNTLHGERRVGSIKKYKDTIRDARSSGIQQSYVEFMKCHRSSFDETDRNNIEMTTQK